jgi:hypothetical protein
VYELPILEGALVPFLVLIVAWAVGLPVGRGVTVALWAAVASIVVLEVLAGWRSRRGPLDIVIQAGVGAAMGLAVIAPSSSCSSFVSSRSRRQRRRSASRR